MNFGDVQIFEGVTTYPSIICMKKQNPAPEHSISFWNLKEAPMVNFEAEFETNFDLYPQRELKESGWEFESIILLNLRSKIQKGKQKFKEVYGRPCRGIVTGLNEAFIVDRKTRDFLRIHFSCRKTNF